ncbi:nodulation protein V [Geobacter sp. OR-1]|uniref:PAS domain-containing protein n=1 Tax=Geobacter sp. OR-1 TaxID=1266765 RepID=UPI00054237D2|nr:PAS domain S-box protein [Geobacter sp. OR-1]GAM10785.1 nodulation protein V [Geobacter sp. OR-1]
MSDQPRIDALKRAEQELTREREFNRCLLESMADGVVACDANGILTLFNCSAREWHGLDPLRLPPEEWAQHYDLFRPDGITPLQTDEIPLARAFRGESVRDAGMAIKAKGQPIRFIIANGSVIKDETGQKLGAVVIMRDVTEFWRMDQELRTANEELEKRVEERTDELLKVNQQLQLELDDRAMMEKTLLLTQSSVDHAADSIMWIKPDGRYCYINEAATRLLGYSIEEFLAMKTSDVNPAHPIEMWPLHWEELKRLKTLFFEAELLRKDGSQVPVEIHANHVVFGDQEYNCASVRDISERKQAEESLLKKARDLNEAQRIAHLGSWELNLLTNQLTWSDEIFRIFEIDPRAFGASYEAFLQTVHPDDRDAVNAAYSDSVRTRIPYSIGHRLLLPGGRIKYVHEQCETFYENDEPLRSVGTVQDVTEQKLVENALRKLSEELEQRVQERTAELEEKYAELERLNKIFVGRELKMVELKERIRKLEEASP